MRSGNLYVDPLGAGWIPARGLTAEAMASKARAAVGGRKRDTGYKWDWRIIESDDLKDWYSTGLQSRGWRDA